MIVKLLIICVGSVTSTIAPQFELNNETGPIVGPIVRAADGLLEIEYNNKKI